MRELFTIDKKNYDENGTVGRRPSVRGIIIKDGMIAMMHSLKYDYYKLPGGGIEEGESYEETLVREVREESGLVVKPDSVREWGYVRRIEKGKIEDIFIQENFYYLCDVKEERIAQSLEDYEEEEQFVLEYVLPEHAIEINENGEHGEKEETQTFRGMLERENQVLELLKKMMNITYYNVDEINEEEIKIAVIVAKHNGKIVLCKHKKRNTWELPGGHREAGETIIEAAKRELYEETGAEKFTLKPLCVYHITKYAMLCYAEIEEFGSLPESEMECVGFFEELPDNMTYPMTHPDLYVKGMELVAVGK